MVSKDLIWSEPFNFCGDGIDIGKWCHLELGRKLLDKCGEKKENLGEYTKSCG